MPRVTWNTKADFDLYYRKGVEGRFGHPNTRAEVTLHYNFAVREVRILQRAEQIGIHFGPANFNQRYLIVGGGFGWLAEAMFAEGFTNIAVTDTSTYIQAEKDNSELAEIRAEFVAIGLDPDSTVIGPGEQQSPAGLLASIVKRPGSRRGSIDILDADILTVDGRDAVRSALGNPRNVITETVLESLEDAEAIALSDVARLFPGPQTVVHLVYTLSLDNPDAQDPVFNWKTLADWKVLLPNDVFIDALTYEVLL